MKTSSWCGQWLVKFLHVMTSCHWLTSQCDRSVCAWMRASWRFKSVTSRQRAAFIRQCVEYQVGGGDYCFCQRWTVVKQSHNRSIYSYAFVDLFWPDPNTKLDISGLLLWYWPKHKYRGAIIWRNVDSVLCPASVSLDFDGADFANGSRLLMSEDLLYDPYDGEHAPFRPVRLSTSPDVIQEDMSVSHASVFPHMSGLCRALIKVSRLLSSILSFLVPTWSTHI